MRKASINKTKPADKKPILIATKNSYKEVKLKEIVSSIFVPVILSGLEAVEEHGETFLEIAQNKALAYSQISDGLAISTDGGAIIPALASWNPIHTRRFAETDQERITDLLERMKDIDDRTLEWHEAIAVADKGRLLFSSEAKAMDAVIDRHFNQAFYKDGIWLCSISSFPQFGGRNYFELDSEERSATEDSWGKLKDDFLAFFDSYKITPAHE